MNSYLPIISGDEIGDLNDFEFLVYVYNEGIIDLGDAFNVVMVNHEAQDFEIVPDIILSFYKLNQSLLSKILRIKEN